MLAPAEERLQDFDERVRVAAVKAVCSTLKLLLIGPAGAASAAAHGPSAPLALSSPTAELLGSLVGSQEEDAAAALELGVACSPPGGADGASSEAAGGGGPRVAHDVRYLQELLGKVGLRLRDTKLSVCKAAAVGVMSVYRAVLAAGARARQCCLVARGSAAWLRLRVAAGSAPHRCQDAAPDATADPARAACWRAWPHAGDASQLAMCASVPSHLLAASRNTPDMFRHVVEQLMRDGPQGSAVQPAQAAGAWVRMWLASNQACRDSLLKLFRQRAQLQVCAARQGCRTSQCCLPPCGKARSVHTGVPRHAHACPTHPLAAATTALRPGGCTALCGAALQAVGQGCRRQRLRRP